MSYLVVLFGAFFSFHISLAAPAPQPKPSHTAPGAARPSQVQGPQQSAPPAVDENGNVCDGIPFDKDVRSLYVRGMSNRPSFAGGGTDDLLQKLDRAIENSRRDAIMSLARFQPANLRTMKDRELLNLSLLFRNRADIARDPRTKPIADAVLAELQRREKAIAWEPMFDNWPLLDSFVTSRLFVDTPHKKMVGNGNNWHLDNLAGLKKAASDGRFTYAEAFLVREYLLNKYADIEFRMNANRPSRQRGPLRNRSREDSVKYVNGAICRAIADDPTLLDDLKKLSTLRAQNTGSGMSMDLALGVMQMPPMWRRFVTEILSDPANPYGSHFRLSRLIDDIEENGYDAGKLATIVQDFDLMRKLIPLGLKGLNPPVKDFDFSKVAHWNTDFKDMPRLDPHLFRAGEDLEKMRRWALEQLRDPNEKFADPLQRAAVTLLAGDIGHYGDFLRRGDLTERYKGRYEDYFRPRGTLEGLVSAIATGGTHQELTALQREIAAYRAASTEAKALIEASKPPLTRDERSAAYALEKDTLEKLTGIARRNARVEGWKMGSLLSLTPTRIARLLETERDNATLFREALKNPALVDAAWEVRKLADATKLVVLPPATRQAILRAPAAKQRDMIRVVGLIHSKLRDAHTAVTAAEIEALLKLQKDVSEVALDIRKAEREFIPGFLEYQIGGTYDPHLHALSANKVVELRSLVERMAERGSSRPMQEAAREFLRRLQRARPTLAQVREELVQLRERIAAETDPRRRRELESEYAATASLAYGHNAGEPMDAYRQRTFAVSALDYAHSFAYPTRKKQPAKSLADSLKTLSQAEIVALYRHLGAGGTVPAKYQALVDEFKKRYPSRNATLTRLSQLDNEIARKPNDKSLKDERTRLESWLRDVSAIDHTRSLVHERPGDSLPTKELKLPPELEDMRPEFARALTPADIAHAWDVHEQHEADEGRRAMLRQRLAGNAALRRSVDAEVAKQIAALKEEFDKKYPSLSQTQKKKLAPWLFDTSNRWFKPEVDVDDDGQIRVVFVPTPTLRKLQTTQAATMSTLLTGNYDEARYTYWRHQPLTLPASPEEAQVWWTMFGTTPPYRFISNQQSMGALIDSNMDLTYLIPVGALMRGGALIGGGLRATLAKIATEAGKAGAEVAVNAAFGAAMMEASEAAQRKWGPLAGQTVALAPLIAIVARRPILAGLRVATAPIGRAVRTSFNRIRTLPAAMRERSAVGSLSANLVADAKVATALGSKAGEAAARVQAALRKQGTTLARATEQHLARAVEEAGLGLSATARQELIDAVKAWRARFTTPVSWLPKGRTHIFEGDFGPNVNGRPHEIIRGGHHTEAAIMERAARMEAQIQAKIVEKQTEAAAKRGKAATTTQNRNKARLIRQAEEAEGEVRAFQAMIAEVRTAAATPVRQLPNGVKFYKFPREYFETKAWNGMKGTAKAAKNNNLGYEAGSKGTFPNTWTQAKIEKAAEEVARSGAIIQVGEGSAIVEGVVDGVRMNVRVRDGVIHSAYPTWIQP